MAEIAIPLMCLGGMYVISNQSNNSLEDIKKEIYQNMSKPINTLSGARTPAKNYPTLQKVEPDNIKKYSNPNAATDRYYNQSVYEKKAQEGKKVGGEIQKIYSLTGKPIDKTDFKHNNMVPFFGAKIRGRTADSNIHESVLDNMQGSGSQQFKKKEVAPLFAPKENLQHANGMPNYSDFYQSRVNPSMKMANVKPWEEQKVAPGLNKGYTTEGSNGFNSGMEARNQWLPKTVDELRVKTNPKVSYSLNSHEGPAQHYVQNRGILGKVEKQQPDTYYANTPDRWFTTTGIEKAQAARGIEVLPDVHRTSTTREYFGAGTNKEAQATYIDGVYEEPKRPELAANPISHAHAMGKHVATAADHGRPGYKALPTNRQSTAQQPIGIVGGMMKAVVAPLMDVLRPSKKENVVGNLRPNGNAGTTVDAPHIYNPNDRLPTTIREMTCDKLDFNHLNVENQKDRNAGYLVNEHQPVQTERDTTSYSYIGNAGGSASQTGAMTYNAAYNQRNNVNKSYKNRPNQGGTQIFNQQTNIQITKKDGDRDNNRLWVSNGGPNAIPSRETHGHVNPGQTYNDEKQNCDRLNPDLLSAFKSNPYTKSLNSWA